MTIETPNSLRDRVWTPSPGPVDQTAAEATDGLRIAMVAPPWFETPPPAYGGIESVVADLVNQLVERGHHITLIGAGEPGTAAQRFIPVYEDPPSNRIGQAMPEIIHAAATAKLLEDADVDIVHDHSQAGPLLARGRALPTVITMHGPVGNEHGELMEWLGDSVDVVAISDSQRRLNPRLNWVGRVYNAIDVNTFPYQENKDDYLLWLGRFSPDKAPDLAIDAARRAGMRIVLAGKCKEPSEKAFFEAEIVHRLGPDVDYVGEADAVLKRELLAGARALCFPLQWDEPFGMVMIEAMACGTPVVALRRGSVPEVVAHGVTGLVVDDYARFPAALRAVESIDPAACRAHVKANFDLPVMAEGYERLYRMMVAGQRGVRALTNTRRETA